MTTNADPSGAFFVVGGTMRLEARSYIQRHADQELFDGLTKREFCYILTARQMGKSSLLIRAAARLRTEGIRVAVLDLTALGQNLTAEQWYAGLLMQLGRRLGLEDELAESWLSHPLLSPLQRWMNLVRSIVLARSSAFQRLRSEVDMFDRCKTTRQPSNGKPS